MVARYAAAALFLLTAAGGETQNGGPDYEMTTYQLVFVVSNPEFEEDEGIGRRLADHRADRVKTASDLYIRNLIKDKVVLLAGPLPDHDRIKQVAVLDMDNSSDTAFVFEHSPAIETGRLQLEIYSWWAAEGILRRPKDPFDTRFAHLGLLRRPADAPDLSEARLREIQKGHLANMEKMTKSGDLVMAGPVENGGDLRGILIFRARKPEIIRELMAEDPAIQARRLELELYRWEVPKRNWVRRSYQTGESPWP